MHIAARLPLRTSGHALVRGALAGAALVLGACGGDLTAPGGAVRPNQPSGTEPRGGAPTSSSANRLAGMQLYVAPGSPAVRQAEVWRESRPADADLMARLGAQPVARWLNEWTGDPAVTVNATIASAAVSGALPIFVAYNIPHRDCGSFSAGGAAKADAYRSWIAGVANGLLGRKAVVVLEPDAIAGAACLSAELQEERFALLRDAVTVLGRAGAMVYLDAGHPRWLSTATAADRLIRAGVADAQGFALNVSNYVTTAENVAYGDALSARIGGKRYIIDTSRNGLGPAAGDVWCNPEGRALGELPTTESHHALVDALMWIKVPGESDGACNGGPNAGTWWPEYGLGLARRSATL